MLAAAACPSPAARDEADASVDAGPRSAVDAGPERPLFDSCEDAGVELPPRASDCGCEPGAECHLGACSWDCSRCSSLSPCPAGYRCDFVWPPLCEGVCRRELEPCATPPSGRVELELTAWQCSPDFQRKCRFLHAVSRDGGVTSVSCSVAATWLDGGVALGTVETTRDAWSPLFSAACHSSAELTAWECVTHGAEIHARYPDGGGFEYGSTSAAQPPSAFTTSATDVFRLCAPRFRSWDGGHYPFIP